MDKQSNDVTHIRHVIKRLRDEQARIQKLPLTKKTHKQYAVYASLERSLKQILKNIRN